MRRLSVKGEISMAISWLTSAGLCLTALWADEIAAIAGVANLPAARLWHLAVALFFDELLPGLAFITLDEQQETVARELGLWIP